MDLGSQLIATSPLGQAARATVPLLDEHAEYADREGRLHDEVVDAFHREGLYQMWVPEVVGGSELDPLHSLETLEIVSYGDPSAGWVLMASCLAIGTAGSYLADDAVAELWADGRRPVIAGQGTRPGTAVPH
jgi:indole-3-acetate monooxygenase